MNLKKILAVVLSMTLLVSCLVSGMSLNTSATTPDPETDAKANLEAAWAALEYTPVVVHDGFWKKTKNDNGANWNWPGSAAASDSELELADGTKIPAYSVVASTDPASNDEAFIVSDKNSHNRPTSNVPVVEGTKLYFYVSGATDGISAFYCRANEDTSFYPTFTTETITDKGGETWTKYGCTVKSGASLVNQKLGRLQFSASTQIFGKKVSAVLIQDPITVPQENSLLELVKKAENIDLNEIQDGEAKNNFVSALAAAVEVLYTTDANTISYLTYKWGRMSKNPEVVFGNFVEKNSDWTDTTTNSTYNSNIGANVYSATAGKPLIVVTGVYDKPTKWANFKTYDEIYCYYSSPNGTATFAPDICTEDYFSYASNTSAGPDITLNQTADANLVKFDLKTAAINASGYKAENYYATGTEKRAMFRLRFGYAPTDLTISQVLGVKPTVVTDTTGKTLGEVIALAEAEDLTTYQNNAAKTEFETALAKAKAAYLSNEENAKAEIIAAWKKVKNNPEILFGNFHKGNKWPVVEPTGIENGIPYYANPDKGSNFIIGGSSYSSNKEGFRPDEYEDFFVYIATSADINTTYSLAFPADESNNNDQVSANNDVKFKLSSTGGALVKYSLKANMTKNSAYTNQKLGRLHITSTNTAITKISYVYGVKPLNLATAFSDVFEENGNAKDLTLAQLINAYTKYDIEKNYDAAELIATVNDVCAANPKYAAFKTVAGYANKVQNVVQVAPPQYDIRNAGITVTKVYNDGSAGVPTFDLYTVGELGTTTFTGQGLDVLGTTDHSTGFVRYGALSTFNSNTNGLYLSYYIPSDTVPATTPIKIQVHYRGTSSTDGGTNYNKAYLKQITLTERDKWAVLDLDDLKVDGLSTLTALENILVDVCAEADQEVTMYFSPFAFTNSANYINTAGATTLTDYAEKYNATAFTEGERYLYEAEFIAARTAFNEALNSEFRISGDAIWHNGNNECFYNKGDSTLATAYRTFAQYTCPIVDGKPVLNKVVVDGTAYELVSRSILIARSADGTFGTLDMSTVGDKYVQTTGENLSAKYWSVADNGDDTATVTYSMLLKDVSQANAESKYHMTRAMIEYRDSAGNTVQVYSKPREHGTIKDTFNYAHGNNNNLQWFPQVND